MSLKDLEINDTYSSSTKDTDLIRTFYNPIIEQATSYDRITGFFSPSVLAIASRGFAGLINTGGKIRLITSVQIDDKAYESIVNGSKKLDETILEDFDVQSIKREIDKDYLSVFAWLYRTGQLEMKVAITSRERSMLHQKIGIVTDAEGNAISFSGSNNETPNGWQHNIEQFKVFKNWNQYTLSFFQSDKEEFDVLWNDLSSKAKVVNIDDAIKEKLIQRISKHRKGDINSTVIRIKKWEHINKPRVTYSRGQDAHFFEGTKNKDKTSKDEKPLRPYQNDAIEAWRKNQYSGIFEMATGTGKTITSLGAIEKLLAKEPGVVVIVVPLRQLVYQWSEEISKHSISEVSNTLLAPYDRNWEKKISEELYYRDFNPSPRNMLIVTTYDTFFSEKFKRLMKESSHQPILLADEMHNIYQGTRSNDMDYISSFKRKLGLSATPLSIWNDNADDMIEAFKGIVFSYDLELALANNYLTPFEYHIVEVPLTTEEFEEYVDLSKQLHGGDGDAVSAMNKNILQKRADIKKKASNKLIQIKEIVNSTDKVRKALFYVSDKEQLKDVQEILDTLHVRSSKFTGDEADPELRNTIIRNLESGVYDAIIAIKCLDEGVDIESAEFAYLLSNNTEPREYIQRLGRVLRRYEGKEFSVITDFVVTPPDDSTNQNLGAKLVKNELSRAEFFMGHSRNKSAIAKQLVDIKRKHGVYSLIDSEATNGTE